MLIAAKADLNRRRKTASCASLSGAVGPHCSPKLIVQVPERRFDDRQLTALGGTDGSAARWCQAKEL